MTPRRTSSRVGIGFESLLIAAFAIGCSSSTTNNNNTPSNVGGGANTGGTPTANTGGTPTANTGGTPGTGGAVMAATGGRATGGYVNVNATGGSFSGDTGGSGDENTGGADNSAGGSGGDTGGAATTTTGGSATTDCNPPVVTKCTGTTPPAALISDFSIPTGGTATTPTIFGTWSQNIYGGTYVYPTADATACNTASSYPITQTLTGGNWAIQGTVGTYSGMGLWWNCMNGGTTASPTYAGACTIDASVYAGISLTVSGNAGTSGAISIQVGTPSTAKPTTDSAGNPNNCGTCSVATCGTNVSVPVTATATPVSFTWAQLGVTTPDAITGISFSFADPYNYSTTPAVATPFAVSITIDDLRFTTN
jgi:hypothetical protein